jgi:hypothetical protein
MDFAEYTRRLNALRVEYANTIRDLHRNTDNYIVIHTAEVEASEYRLRVQQLIEEFRTTCVEQECCNWLFCCFVTGVS